MSRHTGAEMIRKEMVLSTTCDNCGKTEPGEPDEWVHVSTGHNDWGNDSIEATNYLDACSGPCFLALMKREVENYEPTYGTPTFYAYPGRLDYVFLKSLVGADGKLLAALKEIVRLDEVAENGVVGLPHCVTIAREALKDG